MDSEKSVYVATIMFILAKKKITLWPCFYWGDTYHREESTKTKFDFARATRRYSFFATVKNQQRKKHNIRTGRNTNNYYRYIYIYIYKYSDSSFVTTKY